MNLIVDGSVYLDPPTTDRARRATIGGRTVYSLIESVAIARAISENSAHTQRLDDLLRWLIGQIPAGQE